MNSHQRRKARREAQAEAILDCAAAYWREYGRKPTTDEHIRIGAHLLLRNAQPMRSYEEEMEALYGLNTPEQREAFEAYLRSKPPAEKWRITHDLSRFDAAPVGVMTGILGDAVKEE